MRYVSGFSTSWLEIEIIGDAIMKNPKPISLNIDVNDSEAQRTKGINSEDNYTFNTP